MDRGLLLMTLPHDTVHGNYHQKSHYSITPAILLPKKIGGKSVQQPHVPREEFFFFFKKKNGVSFVKACRASCDPGQIENS